MAEHHRSRRHLLATAAGLGGTALAATVAAAGDAAAVGTGDGWLNVMDAESTSRIFLTVQAPGGTPAGVAYVAGRNAGASFTVKGVAGDTSTVAWLIVEPA
ncbi:hypothetical protein [Streptomyces griseorubiginosus]|uniref:hypothetical protein n=1 Tax=Streptomyces griseorubiginosus TaxID=67304 RepID=UPI001AD66131|nr:hypothetical protein [Streptomyces griseorubiginosus]MBO4252996.1 hypothetical protein [Streptomyces griseorubiginosus]